MLEGFFHVPEDYGKSPKIMKIIKNSQKMSKSMKIVKKHGFFGFRPVDIGSKRLEPLG